MRTPLSVSLLLLLAGTAVAQDVAYTSTPLAVGDRADQFAAEDVNGDGRPDLVVQSGVDLRFFLFRPDEGFRKEADFTLRLEANTFLWTLAKLCDDDRPCVVTASSRGIHRYRRTDSGFAPKPEDLVVHPNIFEGSLGPGKAPLHLDFLPDLTGDGLRDAILFARGEILVLPQQRDAAGHPDFRLAQKLSIPIDAGLLMLFGPNQQVREITSVPVLAFGDINGDKRPDISYYMDDAIGSYFQQSDGRFSTQNPLTVGEKRKRRSTYLRFEVPPQIVDLNGDGLLDVVVVYASQGRAQIYFNHGGQMDFSNPDCVLKVADAWSTGALAKDLDGDGKMEIIMGIVRKFGIFGGIDVFLSKKIDLELHVFRYNAKLATYADERGESSPVQQLKFSIPYTFQATRDSANIDFTFRPTYADLDGDGRIDLLVEKDASTLAVYRGVKDRMFADKPEASVSLSLPANSASTQSFVADFNGDGRSDLVLRYVSGDQKKHEVEVKLSKK